MLVPILIVVWVAVLLPPFLRNRREGRPTNSVVTFRRQLSTLERARPGAALGSARRLDGMTRAEVRKRRRDILGGLVGATAVSLVLALTIGGVGVLVFGCCAVLLAGYTLMLVQVQKQAAERAAKVRVLVPPAARRRPEPAFALRRSASS